MSFKLASGRSMNMMGYGTYKVTDVKELKTALDAVLSAGYRLIDTAHFYHNEEQIGDALQELLPRHGLKRQDIWITSKLMPDTDSQKIVDGVEGSLRKLKCDYVDLFLIHYPKASFATNPKDPMNKVARTTTWLALEKLKENGKIREIGVSNYEVKHIEEMHEYATIKPAVNQCECHPHFTRSELRDYCTKNGIFFQAFTSLARNAPELMENDVVLDVAKVHKATAGQILLAWALCQNIGVIPKSSNVERIKSNYDSIHIKLTMDEIDRLNRLDQHKAYTACAGWDVD